MPKTILLLFSFLITLLELQAQTRVLKVADADTRAPLANVSATDTFIEVFMQKNDESLGEVVVIGYGKQQTKDITSAISSIPGKEL